MTLRFPIFLATSLLFLSRAAYGNAIPTSTDEARALASLGSPAQFASPAAPLPIVTSTDEARAAAGSTLTSPPPSPPAPVAQSVSSTDEAREAASARLEMAEEPSAL